MICLGVCAKLTGQAPGDAGLAGFVLHVVEHRAGLRREGVDFLVEVAVVTGVAFDRHGFVAHLHRLAWLDRDGDADRTVGVRFAGCRRRASCLHAWGCAGRIAFRRAAVAALDGDAGRVIPERLQRLARLVLRHPHQVRHASARDHLADRVLQRQVDPHILGHGLVQALHLDAFDLHRHRRHRGDRQCRECEEAGEGAHRPRIPGRCQDRINRECGLPTLVPEHPLLREHGLLLEIKLRDLDSSNPIEPERRFFLRALRGYCEPTLGRAGSIVPTSIRSP
jgi:hypothetical protein